MTLTPQEAHAVQDHLARRTLQVRYPVIGRRSTDRPATDFRGNLERYIAWQIAQEPWRRRASVAG